MKYAFQHRRDFSDLIFQIEQEQIEAHRIICCARSKYLRKLILEAKQHPTSSSIYVVTITNIPKDVFLIVLEFLYTSTCESLLTLDIKQSENIVTSVLKVSKEWELGELERICSNLLKGEEIKELLVECSVKLEQQMKSCLTKANKYSSFTADVTFMVENVEIKAHRVILTARSSYFKALLLSGMKETSSPKITIKEINSASFEILLRFLYSGSSEYILDDNVVELLNAAYCYGIHRLLIICEKRISDGIDDNNVFNLFELSKRNHATHLKEQCLHYMVSNFDTILQKFPVFKEIHHEIKEEIKKKPLYVKYLQRQSKYWETHSAIYIPPEDGGWKKKLQGKEEE